MPACGLDVTHPDTDYGAFFRLQLTAGIVVVLLAAKLILEWLIKTNWTDFELTEASLQQGDTRASFPGRCALNVIGGFFNGGLSLFATFLALRSLVFFPAADMVVLKEDFSTETCHMYREIGLCGSIFTAYSLFQCLNLVFGWEKGLENLIHHVTFTVLGCVISYNYILAEMSAFAIMQELSTPALLVMLTLRRVKGYEKTVAAAAKVFAILFFLVRPVLFTVAMWRGLRLWVTHPEIYLDQTNPNQAPTFVWVGMHALYSFGLCLQYYWFVGIAKKAIRATSGGGGSKKSD